MAMTTMYRKGRQQEWNDRGVDLERFYDEAAVYGMIKMMLSNDDAKPEIDAIDKAKAHVLRSN